MRPSHAPWRLLRAGLRWSLRLSLGSAFLIQAAPAAPAAPDAQALAGERGCLSCHGLVRRQVGPGFAQIAARYRGDAEAASRLEAKVRHGSVGAWRRVIMPAQTRVTEDESRRLVGWILSQPSPPP